MATGELHSVHSCLYMQSENERITAKYKRLKGRYNDLIKQGNAVISSAALPSSPEPTRRLDARCSMSDVATQTFCEKRIEEERHTSKLLQTHATLLRKYEKELAANTSNSETISNLTIANSKLEATLRTTREKEHKSTIALQKFKEQTERKLNQNKEEIFKLTAERDSIRYEYEKLRSEMRGIDKNFFEEVEDLKYALQESAKLNKIYEKTLQGVCKRNKLNYHEILAGVVNRQKK